MILSKGIAWYVGVQSCVPAFALDDDVFVLYLLDKRLVRHNIRGLHHFSDFRGAHLINTLSGEVLSGESFKILLVKVLEDVLAMEPVKLRVIRMACIPLELTSRHQLSATD